MNTANPPARVTGRYLWFRRGALHFALAMTDLVEVKHIVAARPLPLSDESVAGFVSFRERVVPIFDPLALAGATDGSAAFPCAAAFATLDGRPVCALLLDEVGRMATLRFSPEPVPGIRLPAAISALVRVNPTLETLVLDIRGLAGVMGLAAASVAVMADQN